MYITDYTSTRSQQAEPDAALTSHSSPAGAAGVSVPPTDTERETAAFLQDVGAFVMFPIKHKKAADRLQHRVRAKQ